MSNISNRHTVNTFIAGKSSALVGQRLAKIGYKKTKDNPNPMDSICISVPPVSLEISDTKTLARLMPYIHGLLETAQDGIIRSLYESSGGTLQAVTDSEISIDSCINFLAAESAGERFSTEAITAWFNSGVSDSLTVLVADKLGFTDLTEDNMKVIQKHVDNYLGICKLLAGKNLTKNSLTQAQKNGIRVCVKLDTSGSSVAQKIVNRLDDLEKKVDIADLLELDA